MNGRQEKEKFLSEKLAATPISLKTNHELVENILSAEKNVSDSTNEILQSTRKGVVHQIMLTGAVLLLAAACGMPIGYSTVILPQLHHNASDPLRMDLEIASWFASIHSLSAPAGSFSSGPIMDRYGRKPTLLVSIIPLICGWSLIASSQSHTILLIGRVLAGVAVGLIAAPAQILIAEGAEPNIRGTLIGAPFVAYSLGILLTYTLGFFLNWRMVAWCCNILPVLSLVAIFFVPESPTWLVRQNYIDKAERALRWLRCNDRLAKRELNELIQRLENEKSGQTKAVENIFDELKKASVLKPLVIINLFHIMLIFSGTYLIVFYAVNIITEFGAEVDSMTAAIFTAVFRLVFTIVACFLLYTVNRRTLGIFSGIGSGISTIVLAIFTYYRLDTEKTPLDLYVGVACIFLYLASNTNFMVLPGVMIGELLPAKIRGRVAGYIFAAFNIIFFMLAKVFPMLMNYFKFHGVFLMFGLASLGASIIIWLLLPETKGQTLGQIEDYFQGGNWFWFARKNNTKKGSTV